MVHLNGATGEVGATAAHDVLVDMSVDQARSRQKARHAIILDCFRHLIADSTVLCLGAGDGQWCRDIAMGGALHVLGIEENKNLVDTFHNTRGIGIDERIEMHKADPVHALQLMAEDQKQFDIIVVFDLFQDARDLGAIFANIAELRPRIVFADGLFAQMEEPALRLQSLRNAGESTALLRLIPSMSAIDLVATEAGFDVDWADWNIVPENARTGLSDYYRKGPVARGSFTMLPFDP